MAKPGSPAPPSGSPALPEASSYPSAFYRVFLLLIPLLAFPYFVSCHNCTLNLLDTRERRQGLATVLFLTVAVTAYYGTIQATGLDFVDWPTGSKIVSTFGKGDACVAPTIVMMPWIRNHPPTGRGHPPDIIQPHFAVDHLAKEAILAPGARSTARSGGSRPALTIADRRGDAGVAVAQAIFRTFFSRSPSCLLMVFSWGGRRATRGHDEQARSAAGFSGGRSPPSQTARSS